MPKQAYASWLHRVAAAFIDILPPAIILTVAILVALNTRTMQCVIYDYVYVDSTTTTTCIAWDVKLTAVGWVADLVGPLLAAAYVIWNWGYRQGKKGSSIGKSVLGFKVVGKSNGRPIGFLLSLLRGILHIFDAIVFVGFLLPLWDPKRQTLADKIMNTVCVPSGPTDPGGRISPGAQRTTSDRF